MPRYQLLLASMAVRRWILRRNIQRLNLDLQKKLSVQYYVPDSKHGMKWVMTNGICLPIQVSKGVAMSRWRAPSSGKHLFSLLEEITRRDPGLTCRVSCTALAPDNQILVESGSPDLHIWPRFVAFVPSLGRSDESLSTRPPRLMSRLKWAVR